MKQRMFVLAVLSSLIFVSHSEAIVLAPVADATIFDFQDNGSIDFINHTGFPQASNSLGSQDRAIFEFDISSLVGPIGNAILDLDIEASQSPFQLGIYSSLGNGTITDADFFSGALFTTYDYNGEDNIQIDLTSRLDDHVNASNQFMLINIRKEIKTPTFGSTPYVAFNSLEHPRSALLRVNESSVGVVPEPFTCVTLGLGLLGAGLVRRKNI